MRYRKGELIGSGAFGPVFMGMNLDAGELLAVKQVLIAANGISRERAQAHIQELEDEVKLLKNLSRPNIVRYLGMVREEETLNILLEFVPGVSISSLLGKFGPFPETVIRRYTKQLLLGLEYLHNNGIMHRDIKGANILVDNKGCIKLADFRASKQVVELDTVSGAKSMKGTLYWTAPEVILQTRHSLFVLSLFSQKGPGHPLGSKKFEVVLSGLFNLLTSSADIWSVGCTVIEMATGKPPWSQQYQGVAALSYATKSHPEIPEHVSAEAKDFLLKCLQKEPNMRPDASKLLQHEFVTRNHLVADPATCTPVAVSTVELENFGVPSKLQTRNIKSKASSVFGIEEISQDGVELTELKIRTFMDEEALELKKLQTPLYEEFDTIAYSPSSVENSQHETSPNYLKLHPKSRSTTHLPVGTPSTATDALRTGRPGSNSRCLSDVVHAIWPISVDISSPQPHDQRSRIAESTATDVVGTGGPGSNGRCVSDVVCASGPISKDTFSTQHDDYKSLVADVQPESSSYQIQSRREEEGDQELEKDNLIKLEHLPTHSAHRIYPCVQLQTGDIGVKEIPRTNISDLCKEVQEFSQKNVHGDSYFIGLMCRVPNVSVSFYSTCGQKDPSIILSRYSVLPSNVAAFMKELTGAFFALEKRVVVKVRGRSMEPTFWYGARILVEKDPLKIFPLEVNDVVIFEVKVFEDKEMQRVVGLPDDSVPVLHGHLYRNGIKQDEGFIKEPAWYSTEELRVPRGCYYVLGDNRNWSHDSEVWGPLPYSYHWEDYFLVALLGFYMR